MLESYGQRGLPMTPVLDVIRDLEEKLKGSSGDERLSLLRAITDLFLGNVANYSEETVAMFDDVLSRLVEHIELRALAELSAKLAPVATAPRGVVRRLAAADDIQVAGPVLQHSRLSVDDLVAIAASKDQAHLAAIAGRAVVEERVSDILIARGNCEVAVIVARNAGARFSEGGMSKLIERAGKEEGIAEFLASRDDISSAQLRMLVERATDAIRRRLTLRIAPEARDRLNAVLSEIAAEIDKARQAGPKRNYEAAQRFALSMKSDPSLMRVTLREFAQNGTVEQSVALLSALSGVPIPAVERVFTHGDEGGTLILCRAVDLDWPTALAVLNLRTVVGRAPTGSREAALQQYKSINTSTAQRVVRFWRVRATNVSRAGAAPTSV